MKLFMVFWFNSNHIPSRLQNHLPHSNIYLKWWYHCNSVWYIMFCNRISSVACRLFVISLYGLYLYCIFYTCIVTSKLCGIGFVLLVRVYIYNMKMFLFYFYYKFFFFVHTLGKISFSMPRNVSCGR